MLRLILLCCLLTEVCLAVADDSADKFNDLFNTEKPLNNASFLCNNKIEGRTEDGVGCYECYRCDSDRTRSQRARGKSVTELKLYDDHCKPTQICCFSQQESTVTRTSSVCGTSNPEGRPRRVRETLRSVLQGQYPWRTWIYNTEQSEPMCGGVYVDITTRTVVTPASCVQEYKPYDLLVSFSKTDKQYKLRVDSITLHEEFDKGSKTNDIALLRLSEEDNIPEWARVACIPTAPPKFSTACIAVSQEDKYINTIIPHKNHCVADGTEVLHASHLCGTAPKGDYQPEYGGGLFCETETTYNKVGYFVYGINLYKNKDLAVSIYTNISLYTEWLENKFD